MHIVIAIASSSIKELVRQPIGYLLAGATALLIFLSRYLTLFAFDDQIKMMQDIGLDAILICNLMFCVYCATVAITKEIENKTAMIILAKPVRRWQFILGKYFYSYKEFFH